MLIAPLDRRDPNITLRWSNENEEAVLTSMDSVTLTCLDNLLR